MLEQLPLSIDGRIRQDNDGIVFFVIGNCASAAHKADNGSDVETNI